MKSFSLLTLAFLFTVSSNAQLPPYVPIDSLVAYYPFSGNLDDISDNNLNGTGNPTYQIDRLNNSNSALKLASGSNIKLPASLFNFGYGDSFTIAFWFSHNAGGDARIFSTENPEGNFRISNGGGSGRYIIQFGGCCANAGYLYDSLAFPLNWNHLVFTYKSRLGSLYINGKLKSTFRNNSFEKLNYGQRVAIGTKAGSSNDAWIGKFDDLGIWSRELTSLEVINLYNRCPESSTDAITTCDSYTWTNGITYTKSNTTAKDTFVNTTGCDSIVTLNLTINKSDASTDSITACDSYTWTNGITYTKSNTTAKDTFVNTTGCDSIVTLNLTINKSDFISQQPTDQSLLISQNATFDIGTSGTPSLTFQWQIDIGTGYQNVAEAGQYSGTQTENLLISNVTSANDNQKYRCVVNDSFCSDTSEAALLSLYGVSVDNLRNNQIFHIYPNPASDELNIKIESNLLGSQFRIINTLGQEVRQGELSKLISTIDVSKLPKGSYNMLIGTENYSHSFLIE